MGENGVFVFPDAANGRAASSIDPNLLLAMQNGGGFGGNGNWLWIIFLWMMWASGGNAWGNGFGNGFGGNGAGFLSNQLNNTEGRDLLLQAINGRADVLAQLANILNTSIETVKTTLGQLQLNISQVGAQVGMSGLQTINAIESGNAALSRQLCECCCENRLAIANQTAALNSNLAAHDASVRLQLAQNEAADQLAVCQQTNALKSQAIEDTSAILNAIAGQNTLITKEFCDLKERELQSKIETQGDIITQLRGQISNDKQTEMFNKSIAELNEKIALLTAKQPNTVPVQYPNIVAANATPYIGGYGFGYPQNNFWG